MVTRPVRVTKQPVEVHARSCPRLKEEGSLSERFPSFLLNRELSEICPSFMLDPNRQPHLTPSDKERLESLEKKLARLLDEVASLKKHEEKPK